MAKRDESVERDRLYQVVQFGVSVVEQVQIAAGCGCPGPVVSVDDGIVSVFWSEGRCPVSIRCGGLLSDVVGAVLPGAAYAVSPWMALTDD